VKHLSATSRGYLAKLSSLFVPGDNEIIKFLLNINDKELFFFLKEAINNELLYKKNDSYYISFREVIQILKTECTIRQRNLLSRQVLDFYENKTVSLTPVVEGIIKHAERIKDYIAVRKYNLRLVQLYSEQGNQEEAFDIMCRVLDLDFSEKLVISEKDLKLDLRLMLDKSEWTSINHIPESMKKLIVKMPEIAEKHLIIGIFFQVAEKYQSAQHRLERALKLSLTGYYHIFVTLNLAYLHFLQNDLEGMGYLLAGVDEQALSDDLKLEFITYKSLFLGYSGALDEGIQLAEDFLPQIKTENDANYFVRLGNLHNVLGLLYHIKKMLDEAERNFESARKIWEKVNYNRKLGISYNNIGDIALIKGDTTKAFEYFRKALNVCNMVGCKRVKVQGLLNHGEAYNKLGVFNVAEKYLYDAMKLSSSLETRPFQESIVNNLALAKSKIRNFASYHDFIDEYAPDLLKGNIERVTPLTKTYFYYLYEIGDYDKMEDLLTKYESLILAAKEHEFYYQMLGFLHLKIGNHKQALENIELAYNYSKQNRSDYALTINYLRMVQCY
ncbi:MAG TPA: tetratricopeptide repeat protein, partial [Candidatus Cloacimonadota bacterium]|nr:tetratricopeptide repeat protein [Candidatus Cloacimonadota bacterium]